MTESFKAVLAAYPTIPQSDGSEPRLSRADVAHLKRWMVDERAGEVWDGIKRAANKHGIFLPPRFFIQEVLGARHIATSMGHRRKHRQRYRKYAAQIEKVVTILREPLPNGLLLIPTGQELAEKLDEVARRYRDYVAVARNNDRGLQWTRESRPAQVFMSFLSKDLKGITGKWLDYEVAVLTEVAFNEPEIDTDKVLWARRRVKRSTGKGTK
jgi:hypothetical protein